MDIGSKIITLSRMGYRFSIDGDEICCRHEGQNVPDPAQVAPLFEVLKRHKAEVLYFLQSHCPRCGGVVFVGAECFLCEWIPRQTPVPASTPDAGEDNTIPVCGECGHFQTSHFNSAEAFGVCRIQSLSKRPGAYPWRPACLRFEAPAADHETLRLAQ